MRMRLCTSPPIVSFEGRKNISKLHSRASVSGEFIHTLVGALDVWPSRAPRLERACLGSSTAESPAVLWANTRKRTNQQAAWLRNQPHHWYTCRFCDTQHERTFTLLQWAPVSLSEVGEPIFYLFWCTQCDAVLLVGEKTVPVVRSQPTCKRDSPVRDKICFFCSAFGKGF